MRVQTDRQAQIVALPPARGVNEFDWIERVNQAMLDAAELAANPADPDSAIRTYEEAMFTGTEPIAEMSARVQAMMLSPTATEDIARFFTARPTEPAPANRECAAQPASPLCSRPGAVAEPSGSSL